MDGGSRELELERVRTVLRDNIVTPEVRRDGIGGITSRALRYVAGADRRRLQVPQAPGLPDVFDDAFLPPATSRRID